MGAEETMDKIKPLFTATATAIGGRNGHTETSDGIISADLSVPKEMGGPGKPVGMLWRSCRLRCEAAEAGCEQGHDHLYRLNRSTRRRRLRALRQDAC